MGPRPKTRGGFVARMLLGAPPDPAGAPPKLRLGAGSSQLRSCGEAAPWFGAEPQPARPPAPPPSNYATGDKRNSGVSEGVLIFRTRVIRKNKLG